MEQHPKPDGTGPPDLATVQKDIDHALVRRLGLPPRSVIDSGTDALTQHLRRFLGYDYAMARHESGGIAVATLRRVCERNLDVPVRPTEATDTGEAFAYWRNLASLTTAFRDLFVVHVQPAEPET
ncbi:hypothetical protein [Streptomyces californicus]|uniref:hypothetical protein n=1 Tax=Streptomyces californicus TaxID=67351 RepID=UPI0033DB816A